MRSDELNELAAALCKAQAEFTSIPKDSTNPFFKSNYAGLPRVIETASPILTKHGLAVSQFIGVDEHGGDTLTTWLLHSSGQFICQAMRLHLTKDDAQGQGSATTYARRYSYMAVLGLVADDDDDGNAAANRPQQRSAPPAGRTLVTKESADELRKMAHGLTVGQIRRAFATAGLDEPDTVNATIFNHVPQTAASHLAAAFASMDRPQ